MEENTDSTFNERFVFPLLIFLFAFSLRLIYLHQIRLNSPFFDFPLVDAELYVSWAKELSGGNWLGSEVFRASPLYPYFLGVVFRLVGLNYYLVRIIQSVIGSFSCLLVYYLGKKIFSPAVGLIAGLLAASYGLFIFYDNLFLATFLGVFLNLAAVLLILWANARPAGFRYLLAGLFSGLAGICRPNILLFLPVFLFWTAVVWRSRGGRFILKNTSGFVLGLMLVIAPVTVRNYVVAKELVFISSQGGVNFYIGNHPGANGTFRTIKGVSNVPGEQLKDFHRLAEKRTGRKLLPSQVSRYWLREGLSFIRGHSREWLRLTGTKFALFWKGEGVSPQMHYPLHRQFSRLLQFPLPSFVLVSPLAIIGIVLSVKNWRRVGLLHLFIISYLVTVLIFFVTARYRLPVAPFLIVFASYALWWLLMELKKKRFLRAGAVVMAVLALAFLTSFPRFPVDFSPFYCNIGFVFENKNMPEQALEQYRKAIEINPDYVEVHNNLGRLYGALGRDEEALAEYRKALELDPEMKEVHINLGALYDRKGMFEEAIAEYRQVLELDPGAAVVYNNLGALYMKQGLAGKAIEHYQKALTLNPDLLAARINLAELYFKQGELEKAADEYWKVVSRAPGVASVYFRLGVIYLDMDRLEHAQELLEKSSELGGGNLQIYQRLARIYEKRELYLKAVKCWKAVLHLDPANAEAKEGLERIKNIADFKFQISD